MRNKQNITGVAKLKTKTNPWRAQVVVFGKTFYLGQYATEIEAAKAYDNAVYYGSKVSVCPGGNRQASFSWEFGNMGLNFSEDYYDQDTPVPDATEFTLKMIISLLTDAAAHGEKCSACKSDEEYPTDPIGRRDMEDEARAYRHIGLSVWKEAERMEREAELLHDLSKQLTVAACDLERQLKSAQTLNS